MRFDGLKIVWLQSPPWSGLWTRQNHFSLRLAQEGAQILYVENPVAIRSRLKSRQFSSKAEQIRPNLTVLSLPLQIPGGRQSEAIGRLNGWRFGRAVHRWLSANGWEDYLVWCRVPQAVHTLKHLRPRAVAYDVTDDYPYYAKSDSERVTVERLEAKLAAASDQVFTTTPQLAAKLSEMTNSPIVVVPNGVERSFFSAATSDLLPDVPHPRIGYIGLVADWMDFDVLQRLGRRWPGHVVVVGPVKPEVEKRLSAISGLVRIGAVTHDKVPGYLHAFDVCIMPHIINELRHRADPLKIVEYLATGKPIVSARLRPLQVLEPLVDLAASPEAFEELVAQRLADPKPALTSARISKASERTWDSLYEAVADGIERLQRVEFGK